MNWDDLTAIWNRQPREAMPESQLEKLKIAFAKTSRRQARRLFWRDTQELLASAIVIFVLATAAYGKGSAGWPLWISTVLIVGVALFFVRERIRAHRFRTAPNASLLEKIDGDIGELRHQRELLLKVGTWYLAPIILSWFIAMASTRFHGLGGYLRTPTQMASYFVGSLVLFWLIWKLNQWAVHRKIEPKIADLEKLRNDLSPQH